MEVNFSEYINGLRSKGLFSKAEKEIKAVISDPSNKPHLADLYNLLGVVFIDEGRYEEAISSFQEALTLKPEDPVFLTNMAVALKKSGNVETAKRVLEHVLEISPEYSTALNNLANILKDEGKLKEAIGLYKKAIEKEPENLEMKVNLALSLSDMGELKKARDMLVDVVKKAPNMYVARKALGSVLGRIGDFASAEANYRYAILLNPNDAVLYSELGALLSTIEPPCVKEAEDMLKKALRINPNCVEAYQNLGVLYSILGKKKEAIKCYKKALKLRPHNAILLRHIAQLAEFSSDDPLLKRMHELENKDLSKTEKVELFLALSEAYRKMGRFEESFRYLLKANSLKREIIDYDLKQVEKTVDTRIKVFSKEGVKKLKGFGFPSELPVFIVGMPRSGTTLMEALLDSHPDVYGAGELKLFQKVMKAGIYVNGTLFISEDEKMPKQVLKAPEGFFQIGMQYTVELRRVAPWAKRITDKMPGNFFHLGLIICSMPWAKIIHMKRHPLDTLVSCFEQPFTEAHEWTYRLEELAHYYNNYFRLYKHWKEVFPEEILDVDYEMLVLNFEDEMEKVLSHLGLDWHDDIREFYKKQRVVKTASMEQVRKPIYSSSIMRWKRYEKFLDPLISNLSCEVKEEIKRIEEKIRSFIEV